MNLPRVLLALVCSRVTLYGVQFLITNLQLLFWSIETTAGEEYLIGEPSLIFMRDESADIFQRSDSKHLREQELGEKVDIIVAIFCEIIFTVATSS